MKSVYGPVRSWRLGVAMGVDPICRQPKLCNFKCIYCRLGHGGIMITERGKFVDERSVLEEARDLLKEHDVDAVEFRGTGEPFLAKNLVEMAQGLRTLTDVPLCVVTNGSLFIRPEVRSELSSFDVVVVKLDCADQTFFASVNRPHCSIQFNSLLEHLVRARRSHKGSFRVQVTVMRRNVEEMERIVQLCDRIAPDMVYLNTPGRCGSYEVSKREVQDIAKIFGSFKVRTVFDGTD